MKTNTTTVIKIVLGAMTGIFLCGFALFFVLKNTPEHHIHNMRGASNTVYVHDDGRKAVFDAHGELVEDFNQGAYNFAHPAKQPFRHFALDTLPWLLLGRTPDDPTSFRERCGAYAKDLVLGLQITIRLRSKSERES